MSKTIVLNFFGGPGTGKSTGAAYVFALLKMAGINAELVTEAAKDLTWEEAFKNLRDQPYVFGKQAHRLFRCADMVDIIITDSPIFLSTIYNEDVNIDAELHNLIIKVINKYDNINIMLHRVKPYNPVGRSQTESESDDIAKDIIHCLDAAGLEYFNFDGDRSGYDAVFDLVMNKLKESKTKDG